MNNATIQIRTDADIKNQADAIFRQLGLTLSDGINIFLRQVTQHNGLPFDLKLNPANQQEQIARIEKQCGAYKGGKFTTERYFALKQHEKEQERT